MARRPAEQLGSRIVRPELVWPGKYDESGAFRSPSRKAEAFVPLERAGEPGSGAEPLWRNKLIWADNLLAMASLLEEYAGKIDLVYIDPPFATGSAFRSQADVGEAGERPNTLQRHAYDDDFGRGRDRWFSMLYDRLVLIRELLSDRGTLYLHLDWAAGHHARPILDEVFGEQNSLGEVIWAYGSPSGGRAAGQKLIKAHDLIFMYAKRYGAHRFRTVYLPYSEKYVRDWFKYAEPDGRRFRKRWRRDREGNSYVEKQYLDESRGVPCSTVWTDIQQVYADPRAYKLGMTSEVTGFPTQKPMRLLERILEISTEPGDLVADFFCGSGTTLAAAEKLGRRWIGVDTGRLAVHTTRQRLLTAAGVRPYEILGLGSAEARRWLEQEAPQARPALSKRHVAAVLAAYGAEPTSGASCLHGRLGTAAVHVADFDLPATEGQVDAAVDACVSQRVAELHVLAWSFGFDDPAPLLARWRERGVEVLPLRIARELMLAPSHAPAPAEFRELPSLGVHVEVEGHGAKVVLDGFALSRPELVPAAARGKVGRWSDLVEHWAVDWDFDGVFRPDWSAFRTRRDRSLPLTSAEQEVGRGRRRVAVMALDIFGDTTVRVLDLHVR